MNHATQPKPRGWRELSFGFICVFAGLSLPIDALGRLYVRAHAALGSLLLPEVTRSGVALAFHTDPASLAEAPWSLPLHVTPLAPQAPLTVPIDTRTLLYLPAACFVALAVATPLASWRQNARLLGLGLLVLEPLLVLLVCVPLLSFLGGTGPVRVLQLGAVSHTLLQLVYRALVVPPAMVFALPLFLWWILLRCLRLPLALTTSASVAPRVEQP
jgi:hypothetical protein